MISVTDSNISYVILYQIMEKALHLQGFCAIMKKSQKSRICLSERVPELKIQLVSRTYTHAEVKNQDGGKKHERYFNEATIRSRCSLRTSDKKMES